LSVLYSSLFLLVRDHFHYERLEPYLHMKVGYEQLFVGREGTGSPFHHAAVYNMFYMIDGKKQWWFIDPYDTFLAYPMILFGRAAAALLCLWPNEYNEKVTQSSSCDTTTMEKMLLRAWNKAKNFMLLYL
jgi:hypothetical protein